MRRSLYLLCLLGAAHNAVAKDNEAAVTTLLAQAGYWHSKAHDELAIDALQKVLAADQNNINAMYLMALYQLQQGNKQQADIWSDKIRALSPQDPLLNALNSTEHMQNISPPQLSAARELARSGRTKEAIVAYKALFSGQKPPADLALEYYQTLAGDDASWSEAAQGLRQRALEQPGDSTTKQALATVLTYKGETRREGIALLETLPAGAASDKALQQALLWLEPKKEDLPLYSSYLSRHPEDNSLVAHFRQQVDGDMVRTGFNALNNGELTQAVDKFNTVLKTHPDDSNALAGLGYIALRKNNFDQAEQQLRHAAQGGSDEQRQRWLQDADNAHFYARLNQARTLSQHNQYDQALQALDSVQASTADQRLAAGLLQGDIYRRQGQSAQAETLYRQLLRERPASVEIKSGLLWVLRQQKKQAEADALLATLPAALRSRYANVVDNSEPVRKAAAAALQGGNSVRAMQLLQDGVAKYPDSVWLRYDYARALRAGGEKQRADDLINALLSQSRPQPEAWHAAALYADSDKNWPKVMAVVAQAPAQARNEELLTLEARAKVNRQMDVAENYLNRGNEVAALNSLHILSATPPDDPRDVGRLAELLMKAGDSNSALSQISRNQAQGLHGSVADYATQIQVLNQAGRFAEAESVINAPALLNTSSEQQIRQVQSGYLISRADLLRQQGDIAGAWQIIMPALKATPTDTALLLATARIYQADDMADKAGEIYHYILRRDPRNREALYGAVNLALANHDAEAAQQSFRLLDPSQDADYFLLSARVAAANGNNTQAMALLRSAQWRLQQNSNPLTAITTDDALSRVLSVPSSAQQVQQSTRTDVDRLLADLQEKTATTAQASFAVDQHSGESGLSSLSQIKTPLTLSTAAGDAGRLNVTVTPVTLNAGDMSAESASRFGSGAITRAERRAASTSTDLSSINADSLGGQQVNGVESGLSLSGDSYKLDIGSTPTGGEFTRVVGGIKWQPQLTQNSTLTLQAERRAVTDSLLSYVGAKDAATGERWGAITRNGVSAQYAWDNDLVGLYARLGFDTYIGENVPTNHGVDTVAGSYIRPYQTKNSELKVGVNMHYMDFDKNLSYFTLGQGGYFSPQNYLALSLPVELTYHWKDWDVSLSSSVGYQSYKQSQSDYFPGHESLQSQLDQYASSDSNIDSVYKSTSKNGINYLVGINTKYNLNSSMALGTNIGYNTFGNYNEGKALFYFRYYFNSKKSSVE
ncbi:cellulose synthase subunit BcsC-related outer membrane protein [Pantoea sp. B65]|uniref:cellulose biosynthesis protein BcsC n=1 Tax=Pantoea sp. B65 TaxID=2813359 RepID=UPI0039B3F165